MSRAFGSHSVLKCPEISNGSCGTFVIITTTTPVRASLNGATPDLLDRSPSDRSRRLPMATSPPWRRTSCLRPRDAQFATDMRAAVGETRVDSMELKIHKLRNGSCFPAFLEPRRTAEKALAAVIQEAGACPRAGAAGPVGPGHLDPQRRRVGQGARYDGHQQEPGLAPVRRDRPACRSLPRTVDRGRLAVPVDRSDLREGSRKPGASFRWR